MARELGQRPVSGPPRAGGVEPSSTAPPPALDCKHYRRRHAAQARRDRFKLPRLDLFQWADPAQ
jgi:hypothetical protein